MSRRVTREEALCCSFKIKKLKCSFDIRFIVLRRLFTVILSRILAFFISSNQFSKRGTLKRYTKGGFSSNNCYFKEKTNTINAV